MSKSPSSRWVRILFAVAVVALSGCHEQSMSVVDWFITRDQQGQHLFDQNKYEQAAKKFHDPMWQGVALYREGEFRKAAAVFGQIDSAEGWFNRGNALLMHGQYDDAIESYNRALQFRHDWKEARDNRAIAVARGQAIKSAGRHQEEAAGIKADAIVVGKKSIAQNSQSSEVEVAIDLSDPTLRQMWLRRVQTTPQEFLRAKFAYQAANESPEKRP